MSNPSGRPWYRFSSIVRPTPSSSRDPSPTRHIIEQPSSQAAPPQRSSPKEDREATPSPVLSSRSIKYDEPPKPRHEHESTRQKILTFSDKTNLVHGTNKEQQQQQEHDDEVHDDVIMSTQGVITILGENKGAVMEILRSPSKTLGTGKGRRLQSSSEEKSKSNNHRSNDVNLPMDGFVNSNVQMISSSVVYNSTETHHDPGVHLSLYRKPSFGSGFILKDHGNGYTSSIN
ncbi:hypothetical protein V5N11_035568 [Cardamine amara subsp. amara]|uniref:Uncharacterized protein n=1 Tax=Cardamine amara subsp. amara TaxID=228776 RepID=A0ABD1B8N6_CARAN